MVNPLSNRLKRGERVGLPRKVGQKTQLTHLRVGWRVGEFKWADPPKPAQNNFKKSLKIFVKMKNDVYRPNGSTRYPVESTG